MPDPRDEPASAVSEAEIHLRRLGLSDDAAHVYASLRRLGPALASAVAFASRVPRPRVYRILGDLQRRGFVRTTLVRPQLFAAEPAETLARCLRAEEQERAAGTGRSVDAFLVASAAEAAGAGGAPAPRGSFRLLQGLAEARTVAAYALATAVQEVRVLEVDAGRGDGGREALRGWLPALKDVPHGVPVRLLVGSPADTVVALPSLVGHPLARVRRLGAGRDVRFLLADEKELLLDLGHPSGDPAAGSIWTDAPGLVRSVAGLFDVAWASADQQRWP